MVVFFCVKFPEKVIRRWLIATCTKILTRGFNVNKQILDISLKVVSSCTELPLSTEQPLEFPAYSPGSCQIKTSLRIRFNPLRIFCYLTPQPSPLSVPLRSSCFSSLSYFLYHPFSSHSRLLVLFIVELSTVDC